MSTSRGPPHSGRRKTRLIALKPKGELGILLRAFLYEKLGKADLAIADYDALLGARSLSQEPIQPRAARQARRSKRRLPGSARAESCRSGGRQGDEGIRLATDALECRVYLPGAGITVSVPCAR